MPERTSARYLAAAFMRTMTPLVIRPQGIMAFRASLAGRHQHVLRRAVLGAAGPSVMRSTQRPGCPVIDTLVIRVSNKYLRVEPIDHCLMTTPRCSG